jgi:ABC-type uncharacterized transport system permease subunit
MQEILLQLIAAALYAGLSLQLWQQGVRQRHIGPEGAGSNTAPALAAASGGLGSVGRGLLLMALLLHVFSLRAAMFPDGQLHFGFATALSATLWLSVAFYWIESFYTRIEGLPLIGLPLAALCVVLPSLVPAEHAVNNAGNPAFRLHFLVAMLAYSLFTLAAMHSLLMMALEKRLHHGRLSPFMASFPPLLTMEQILFRLIHIAFILLTLTLVSGALFSEEMFGKALTLNHKTVFAIISWLIFAALLLGRHLRGWRGRLALRWTLSGFVALLLAYAGSYFVLDVLLHRGS